MKMDVEFSSTGSAFDVSFDGGQQGFEVKLEGGCGGANGATFYPSVSPDGVLSWTNDRGLENPAPVNVKGEPGVALRIGQCMEEACANNLIGYDQWQWHTLYAQAEKVGFGSLKVADWPNVAYFRISACGITNDSVITIE